MIKSLASPEAVYPTVLIAFPIIVFEGNSASSQISLKIYKASGFFYYSSLSTSPL
jgi:hypothetical protein